MRATSPAVKKTKSSNKNTAKPKLKLIKISTNITPTLHKKMKSRAAKEKRSISNLISAAIESYLK